MKYTKTTIQNQLFPASWKKTRLGQLGECLIGLTYSPADVVSEGGTLVLRSSNVQSGRLRFDDNVYVKCAVTERLRIRENDILICVRNGSRNLIGKSALIRGTAVGETFGAFMAVFRTASSSFVFQLLQTHRFKKQIDENLGATINQITNRNLDSFSFWIPPRNEQQKIADILGKWDEALEKLDALIEAKDRRRKALTQRLLSGRKRLKGFTGKWTRVQLRELAENVADQNKGRMGTTSLYGVTKSGGVVPMREHVKGESFARCKRVETDWFAYNPMRINIGSIARWQGAETVMVSGDYVVFRCKEERLSPAYLDHLRKSWMWESFVTRGGNGSVRIRIYFADLGEFSFLCPPVEEQRSIAAILDACDDELRLLRLQRAAIERQKRGLMQRLLTGKIRVATS